MICTLQYSPRISPDDNKPLGWIAYRPDRSTVYYRLDHLTVQWRQIPKQPISDGRRAVTQAWSGENFGPIVEQFYDKSDPDWLTQAKAYLSARMQLRLIDAAFRNGQLPWPPYDPTIGEES